MTSESNELSKKKNLSIIVPTYNESENISRLLEEISKNVNESNYEILVVDDNSPDGTGKLVEKFIENNNSFVRLIMREKKEGIIQALLEGIKESRGENILVMDADFSHLPNYIPDFLRTLKENSNHDIVIGSRYVDGGSIVGWPITRHLLSKGANYFARSWLNVKTNDITTGFFLVRKRILENVHFTTNGHQFLLELLVKSNYKIAKEIPIKFQNRIRGKSNLDSTDIRNFISSIIELRKFQKNK
jgi:dolichol-phosphate mannosyltransferase